MIEIGSLGAHIHGLRSERGLGLQALAAASRVSVSMLSAIERGEKAPTIVVLSRIAEGLGMSVTRLLAGVETERVIVRRAAEQEVIDEPGGWQRRVLTPVVPGVNFEWIRTTLPPGCDAGEFPAYAAGSHEFVAVEQGALHLTIGDTGYDLATGDALYFSADVVHAYANRTGETCVYHVAALIMRPRTARKPT